MTVNDLVAVRRLQDVQISPNGQSVLFTTRGADLSGNVVTRRSYIVATAGNTRPVQVPDSMAGTIWSWDSNALTYTRDRGGCTQLWSVSVRNMRKRRIARNCLTRGGQIQQMRWSPTGRYLAFIVRRRSETRAASVDTLDKALAGIDVGAIWVWGCEIASPALRAFSSVGTGPLPPSQLWIWDAVTQQSLMLSESTLDVYDFEWEPNGRRIAFAGLVDRDSTARAGADSPDVSYGGYTNVYVAEHRVTRAKHVARLGYQHGGAKITMSWSPKSDRIAISRGTWEGGALFDVHVPSGRPGTNDTAALTLSPSVSVGWLVGRVVWSADARELYVTVQDRLRQSVFAVDLAHATVRDVFPDLRWYGVPSFSRDGRSAAVAIESVTVPPRLFVVTMGAVPKERVIVDDAALNPHLAGRPAAQFDTVSWRSPDGRWTIHGVLVVPAAYQPPQKLPLVVALKGYGNAANMEYGMDSQYYPVLVLAASGYAVLVPNPRGRLGFGKEFLNARELDRTYFSKPWTDVVAGVDLLIERGIVDPDRLGIMGFSYGGALAAYGIGTTSRFKAAVLKEAAGIDLRFAFRSYWGYPPLRLAGERTLTGITSPYDSASLAWMDRESPIERVRNVRTPTLLEFGVKNIDATYGGNPFFQALQYFGVPSEFILYPRTAHAFEEPALIADSFRREVRWFDRWLQGGSAGAASVPSRH